MKKYSVQIEDSASLDIQEAIYYYEGLSKGLGERFAKEVGKASNILKLNPHFQVRYDAVRCLKVKSFPYSIHYVVNEDNAVVIIQAVIHTASDPNKTWLWKDE
jgi:mRNA-degrading endonuclease RelE of RelBE toxin-antitoxin system